MIRKLRTLAFGAALLISPLALNAKPAHTLLPFAGSYTGMATSTTADGPVSGSSTLTFTGKKKSLRGTFLYTGILNFGGVSKTVVQTFNISKSGLLAGRVSLDGVDGIGSGQAFLKGKKLTVSITYTIGPDASLTVSLNGQITFKGKHATWTAIVSSSDPTGNGSLSVTGKR
jgi:hypothetical protein